MNSSKRRIRTAVLLVACCIAISLGLAIAKMYVGLRSNSLVIMLDGVNSFFDVATGVVTLVAFCLLFHPRTDRHPYGFGRGEYLAGFVVSAVTVVMGVVFFLRSVNRLAMAEPVYYRLSSMIIISVALVVKIGMTLAYGLTNRRIHSHALRALLWDGVLDVGMTTVSVLSFTLSQSVSYAFDAWFGLAVSLGVVAVGIRLVVDNTRLLLGGDVRRETALVRDTLSSIEGVLKVGRVVLSDYGYHAKAGYAEVTFASGLSLEDVCAIDRLARERLRSVGVDVRLVPSSN